jgi:hypothetical protein
MITTTNINRNSLPEPPLHQPGEVLLAELKIWEITRRASIKEQQTIARQLNSLNQGSQASAVETLVDSIQHQCWEKIDFKNRNVPFYALEALRQGKISPHQFGTLQLFWSACGYWNRTIDNQFVFKIPIFLADGSINPQAKELIQQTVSSSKSIEMTEEMTEFFEEMKKQPRSEQFFLLIPKSHESNQPTVLDRINEIGFNVFGRCTRRRVQYVEEMIPSFGMMQAFLNVKYKEQAITLNPVLGLSSLEDLENLDRRDVALSFPGVTLPEKADGFLAPAHQFSWHDFYHAYYGSSIPKNHRELFNQLGLIAKDCGLEKLREFFVDREFKSYKQLNPDPKKLTETFWKTVEFNMHDFDHYLQYSKQSKVAFLQKIQQNPIIEGGEKTIARLIRRYDALAMCSIQ